jgi:hypothetical protein
LEAEQFAANFWFQSTPTSFPVSDAARPSACRSPQICAWRADRVGSVRSVVLPSRAMNVGDMLNQGLTRCANLCGADAVTGGSRWGKS